MKLDEILPDVRERAGFIPYVYENGEPLFYFMTPSKAQYGGSEPQIAKGGIDTGEGVYDAALREGREELGLKRGNLIKETIQVVFSSKIRGKKESYKMTVYMGEVKDKDDFKKPHYETKSTHWLTEKQFIAQGRKAQASIVRKAGKLLAGDK